MKIEKIIVYLCKTGKRIEKIERKDMKEKKENPDCCPENTHKHFRGDKTLSEIINDTVTESLKYCLKTHIENTFRTTNLDEKLTSLFLQADNENPFNEKETHFLVEQINRLKILDLTVGDGTLLVEVLNKLTFLLSKLDPLNEKWKQQQIRALDRIADPTSKSELHETIETVFNQNAPDYARKRYLIQNCLYGICRDPSSLNAAKLNLLNCLLEEQEAAPDMNACEDIDSLFHLETHPLPANAPIGSSKYREEKRCHTNRSDDEFNPETITTGFDIVFGNLHCVSATVLPSVEDDGTSDVGNLFRISTTAKEVPENEKNPLMQSHGFDDELYARLIFKGFELLKSDGILALLIPQSYWKNLNESTTQELLRKDNLLEISDTPSPFSEKISTTTILLQKTVSVASICISGE
jgi:hypothetical protein